MAFTFLSSVLRKIRNRDVGRSVWKTGRGVRVRGAQTPGDGNEVYLSCVGDEVQVSCLEFG